MCVRTSFPNLVGELKPYSYAICLGLLLLLLPLHCCLQPYLAIQLHLDHLFPMSLLHLYHTLLELKLQCLQSLIPFRCQLLHHRYEFCCLCLKAAKDFLAFNF